MHRGNGTGSLIRFRETYLRLEGVPQPIIDYWLGHGKKRLANVYTKAKGEANKRRDWCETAGLGFPCPKQERESSMTHSQWKKSINVISVDEIRKRLGSFHDDAIILDTQECIAV
jgi:hypothetical protein